MTFKFDYMIFTSCLAFLNTSREIKNAVLSYRIKIFLSVGRTIFAVLAGKRCADSFGQFLPLKMRLNKRLPTAPSIDLS